jgi:hypothetical protein
MFEDTLRHKSQFESGRFKVFGAEKIGEMFRRNEDSKQHDRDDGHKPIPLRILIFEFGKRRRI